MDPGIEKGYVNFMFCITEEIPIAFSNLFQVYRLAFDKKYNEISLKHIDTLSASPLNRDTFYATKMLAVPDSGLLILTLENTGALLLNMTCLEKDRIGD